MSDDHAGVIDTHMEFFPPARATAPVFRSSPFTLADDRQTRAVDDEIEACARWNVPKRQVEVLATTGQCRVIRRPKVEPHEHEERREESFGLTKRQMEEKTHRQGGCDREVRVLPLRAPRARSVRFPGGDGRRGQPDGDIASTDQGAIVGGPVPDVVLRLVRGMDSRFHPSSLNCRLETSHRIRAPTPPWSPTTRPNTRTTAPRSPISPRDNENVRCEALRHPPTRSGSYTSTVSFRICFAWVGTCSGRVIIGCCERELSPCGPR